MKNVLLAIFTFTTLIMNFAFGDRLSLELSNDFALFGYDAIIPYERIHTQNEFAYHENNSGDHNLMINSGLGLKEKTSFNSLYHMGFRLFYNNFDNYDLFGTSIYTGFSNVGLINTGFVYNSNLIFSPSILNNTHKGFISDISLESGYKISRGNTVYAGYRNQNILDDSFEQIHSEIYIGISLDY